MHFTPGIPWNTISIERCQIAGADATPYTKRLYRFKPFSVLMVNRGHESSATSSCKYARFKSTLENCAPPDNAANMSSIFGRGFWSTSKTGCTHELFHPSYKLVQLGLPIHYSCTSCPLNSTSTFGFNAYGTCLCLCISFFCQLCLLFKVPQPSLNMLSCLSSTVLRCSSVLHILTAVISGQFNVMCF